MMKDRKRWKKVETTASKLKLNATQSRMLTALEAAKLLGVTKKTLRNWEKQGRITPARTVGGHRRYDENSLSNVKKQKPELLIVNETFPVSGPEQRGGKKKFLGRTFLFAGVLALVLGGVKGAGEYRKALGKSWMASGYDGSGVVLAESISLGNMAFNVRVPTNVSESLTVDGVVTIGSGLGVTGDTSMDGSLTVTGAVTVGDLGTGIVTATGGLLTLSTGIDGGLLNAGSIVEAGLSSTNDATDNYVLSFDLATGGFTWVAQTTDTDTDTNYWTDSGTFVYLTTTTDKLRLGSSSTPSALLHVGSGGTPTYIDGTDDVYVYDDLEVSGTIYGNIAGTITPNFTEGSVVFADASGNLAENNSAFYWDDTNEALTLTSSGSGTKFSVNNEITTGNTQYMITYSDVFNVPTGNALSKYIRGIHGSVTTDSANDQNFSNTNLEGAYVYSAHEGSGTIKSVTGGTFSGSVGGDGTVTSVYGLKTYSQLQTNSLSATATSLYGIYNKAGIQQFYAESSSVTNAYGIFSEVGSEYYSGGTGTITNAYNLYLNNYDIGSGYTASVVTNNYGLYIETPTRGSTLNYSLYSAGGDNYFGGNVGIGFNTGGDGADLSKLIIQQGSASMYGIAQNMGIFSSMNSTGGGTAGFFTAEVGSAGNDLIGVDGRATILGTTVKDMIGLRSRPSMLTGTATTMQGLEVYSVNSGGTLSTSYGIQIDFDNTGTSTNTYGLHIGDITSGTQTYTPYSIYASDSGAWNYFAGNVGIGVTAPSGKLHVYRSVESSDTGSIYGANIRQSLAATTNVSRNVSNYYSYLDGSNANNLSNTNLIGMRSYVTKVITGTLGNMTGLEGYVILNEGTAGNLEGFDSTVYNLASQGDTVAGDLVGINNVVSQAGLGWNATGNDMYGIKNSLQNYAMIPGDTSAISNAYGLFSEVGTEYLIGGTASITNAYNIFLNNYDLKNGGSASALTNNYQLYIETPTRGTSVNYSIYSQGGNNYFGGNVGIGTTSPTSKLHISETNTSTSTYRLAELALIYNPAAAGSARGIYVNTDIPSSNSTNLSSNSLRGGYFTTGYAGTGSLGTLYGMDVYTQQSDGTVTTIIAQNLLSSLNDSTGGSSVTSLYGVKNRVILANSLSGATTAGSAYGIFSEVGAEYAIGGTATITNAYNIYLNEFDNDPIFSNGTVTNNYGLYIETPTRGSTKNFSIYSEGGTNYFGGNIGIGVTNPSFAIQTTGSIVAYGDSNVFGSAVITSDDSFYFSSGTGGISYMGYSGSSAAISLPVTSTTSNSKGISISHTGVITGTGYGISSSVTGASTSNVAGYFSATGATNNYAGIFANGSVGIGVTNPSYKLHLNDNSGTGVSVTTSGASTNYGLSVNPNGAATINYGVRSFPNTFNGGTNYGIYSEPNSGSGATNYAFYGYPHDGASNADWGVYITGEDKNYFSGNVGIGTTSPTSALHVVGSTHIMSGFLGVGTTAPDYELEVRGQARVRGNSTPQFGVESFSGGAALIDYITTTTNAYWQAGIPTGRADFRWNSTAGGDVMTLTSGALVGIGTTAPTLKLDVRRSDDGSVAYFADNDNSCTLDPDGDLTCTSDIRLKKDVSSLDEGEALSTVNSLRAVRYSSLNETEGDMQHFGFIAQEVETVAPELVMTNEEGYMALAYSRFTPLLTAAIQELSAQIEELKIQEVDLTAAATDITAEKITTTDLTVLGETLLAETTIVGGLNIGLIQIDPTETSIDAVGTLKLQSLALGSVEIMNGKVVINEDGNVNVVEGVVAGNDNFRGSETLEENETVVRVDREWTEAPVTITATANYDTNLWITEKDETGFTINVGTSPLTGASIDWVAIW